MEPNDNARTVRTFGATFVGALLLGGICLWISNLTSGPEYGGRWDVPALNNATWFTFCSCILVAFLSGLVLASTWEERRSSDADRRS